MKRKQPMWRKRERNYVFTPDRHDKWIENKNNPIIEGNGYEAGQDVMLEKILALIAERADYAGSTDASIELSNLYRDIERIFS